MQPTLDQRVGESDERVSQFLKIMGRHLLKYLFVLWRGTIMQPILDQRV